MDASLYAEYNFLKDLIVTAIASIQEMKQTRPESLVEYNNVEAQFKAELQLLESNYNQLLHNLPANYEHHRN